MKRTRYLPLLLVLWAGLFLVDCSKEETAEITTINVVATGNVWGEIEPCG